MSRSYHQYYPLRHSKRNKFPYPDKWKMRPHGLVYFTDYGGEVYFKKLGEIDTPIINKRLERKKININDIEE